MNWTNNHIYCLFKLLPIQIRPSHRIDLNNIQPTRYVRLNCYIRNWIQYQHNTFNNYHLYHVIHVSVAVYKSVKSTLRHVKLTNPLPKLTYAYIKIERVPSRIIAKANILYDFCLRCGRENQWLRRWKSVTEDRKILLLVFNIRCKRNKLSSYTPHNKKYLHWYWKKNHDHIQYLFYDWSVRFEGF